MATVIDALVITLGLDPKGVQKGMADAEKTVSGGMSRIVSTIRSFVAPLAGAFAAGALFKDWLKGADALGKFSASVGQNIEDMNAWQEAVIRAGGTADGFTASFETINSRIAMAGAIGSGRGKKVFEQLGIALKDASGKVRDTKEVMLDLADAAQKMDKAQFVGLARMLGLDAGTIRALQQGREALAAAIQKQKELGVFTEADAKITADLNDRLADFRQALRATAAIVFRTIVPALTEGLRAVAKFISYLRQHEKAVQAFFVIFATAITAYALPALAKLAAAALTNPFTVLIAGVAALAIALEDLYVWANGGKAAFGAFWAKLGTPEEVKAGLENLLEKLKSIGKFAVDAAQKFGPIILRVLALVAAAKLLVGLYKAFMMIKTAIVAVQGAMVLLNGTLMATPIGWIVAGVTVLIGLLYLVVKNWDKIKDAAGKTWQYIKDKAAEMWEKIKGIFTGAAEWFAGVFSGIADAIIAPFKKAFEWIADKWRALKTSLGMGAEINAGAAGTVGVSLSGSAAHSIRPSRVSNIRSVNNSRRETHVNVGKVEVKTNATDADGIARDIGGGLERDFSSRFTANQAELGVR